ncbi:hypothetical protein PHYBOEH_002796 [Phytophthora boehmeriae]|uniref:SAP domain-containing protein n=1 Tax=Phytophthora boehmeriae TaxID=109152 RepID=A0A8T1WTV9_9STRA|nr:hypothetical protein PHYBOEH_002796 [Phytophthora boehmeriae]
MSDSLRLQLRNIRQRLNMLRMPELRNILMDLNLARSGRKSELVDRIAMELESFADKARGNSSAAFYAERFSAGMASVERQLSPRRSTAPTTPPNHGYNGVYRPGHMPPQTPPSRYAPPPPQPRMPSHPVASYARNIPPSVGYNHTGNATAGAGVIPLTSGVDLYNPRFSSALEGARCFCATQAVSGKVVRCTDCGVSVHAKCHQLVTLVGDWTCETCRSNTYDPFYRVKKGVLNPSFVRFAKSSCSFRLEYYITDSDINDMYAKRDQKPGAMTPGSLELQLRCFAVKEDLAAGHCWPACTQLSVNGFAVPITQRAPPGHANPSKVLRELPANVFQFSRVGRNVIDIQTTENPTVFGFMVQIVEVRDINDLINEVKEASKNLTYEGAKQEVIKSFGSEDEDDIQKGKIEGVAVYSLSSSKQTHYIKAADLRIDPYLKKLLADVAGEDELEEVEIFPDGSWKRRVDDEIVPEPPVKRVKAEQVEVGASTTNGSTTAATATTNNDAPGSSAAAPVEIDLLSSDDEDDDDTPQTTVNAAQASASAPILLDDDIDILTVNSDAWDDTPTTSTAGSSTTNGGNGDGNCGEYFPFPLDENLFPSNGSAANNGGSSWMYSVPVSTIVSSMPPPSVAGSSTSASTSTTYSPPPELLNQSESNLATSMANLSRNHPNVSNPFEQRQRRQARPPPKPQALPSDLDIICLLDSDSD